MRLLNIKPKVSAFLRYNKGISTKLFLPLTFIPKGLVESSFCCTFAFAYKIDQKTFDAEIQNLRK